MHKLNIRLADMDYKEGLDYAVPFTPLSVREVILLALAGIGGLAVVFYAVSFLVPFIVAGME